MIRRRWLVLLCAAAFFALPQLAQAELPLRVGYVDVGKILDEVPAAKAAQARVATWYASQQETLQREQAAIKKVRSDFVKKQPASEEAKKEMERELEDRIMRLQARSGRIEQERQAKEEAEMAPIHKRVDEEVRRIAQRDHLAMVFDVRKAGLVFVSSELEITNEVIRRLNEK